MGINRFIPEAGNFCFHEALELSRGKYRISGEADGMYFPLFGKKGARSGNAKNQGDSQHCAARSAERAVVSGPLRLHAASLSSFIVSFFFLLFFFPFPSSFSVHPRYRVNLK
jgi:hypothetical protein